MCEDLLARVSTSILKNKTLASDQLLVFLYSIIEKGVNMSKKLKINDEKSKRDYGAKFDPEQIRKTKLEQKELSYSV